MSFKFGMLLGAMCLVSAQAASAAVVTFDSLDVGGWAYTKSTSFDQESLSFISSSGAVVVYTTGFVYTPFHSGATIAPEWNGDTLTVTKAGGGDFDLVSFDIADAYNAAYAYALPFSYVQGGTTYNAIVNTDALFGLQTVALNLSGISSFSLTNAFHPISFLGGFQIDNIVLAEPVVGGAVPEPATWGMMIAGLGVVGAAMRRRNLANTVRFA
jgi:uncharacterized RDD family membrane protein YckC